MDSNYINSDSSLADLCLEIKDDDIVAVDTEFVRRTTYYPILSLIQIAFNKQIYLIDAIAIEDISPILDVINNPKIKKVLHSSIQDLQIFYQKSSVKPKNIYDTQILANFCGFGFNSSYASLVNDIFGVKIDKEMQVSNWLKRPLSDAQTKYAKIDVVYLEDLYKYLIEIVEKRSFVDKYEQDVDLLINSVTFNNIDSLLKSFLKGRNKILKKNKVPIKKVYDLLAWRDEMAAKINVPRRHLISDDDLESVIIGKDVNLRLGEKMQNRLDELLKKSNYNLDLETKSYSIGYDKEEFILIRKELSEIAKSYGIDERFIIGSVDLRSIFYQDVNFDNLTQWRKVIINELKDRFGYEK